MLIADAEVYGRPGRHDVRVTGGRIDTIGRLSAHDGEPLLDAAGGALLPGLHDHHVHLLSFAASLSSVACGPPDVRDAGQLAAALQRHAASGCGEWLRGVGYHESVAGEIDRGWLDQHGPECPVRIQHRSGRLWILNSPALAELGAADPRTPLPADGRLYDADSRLRMLAGAALPPVGEASRLLAGFGVTGITDMTPHNDAATLQILRVLRRDGGLLQQVRLAGGWQLGDASGDGVTAGETKFHLHETGLPPLDELVRSIAGSHARRRPIAVHCVTETELVFTLAAIREAGAQTGDRIEHASVTPPALLEQLAALGLVVVTQPNFVAERGDTYLTDIPPEQHGWLYRGRSFLDAGIALAAGSDMPFGRPDPWAAMRAAVNRRTREGQALGPQEALTPEQALALFTGRPEAPARPRAVEPGAPADLCLLRDSWASARTALGSDSVAATIIEGQVIWRRGDRRPPSLALDEL